MRPSRSMRGTNRVIVCSYNFRSSLSGEFLLQSEAATALPAVVPPALPHASSSGVLRKNLSLSLSLPLSPSLSGILTLCLSQSLSVRLTHPHTHTHTDTHTQNNNNNSNLNMQGVIQYTVRPQQARAKSPCSVTYHAAPYTNSSSRHRIRIQAYSGTSRTGGTMPHRQYGSGHAHPVPSSLVR